MDAVKGMTPDDMELLLRTRDTHPILYDRVMGLLNLVHDPAFRKADDVEFDLIDKLRGIGSNALTSWSSNQASQASACKLEQEENLRLSEKKSSLEDNLRRNCGRRTGVKGQSHAKKG